jgi:hypothetical protein
MFILGYHQQRSRDIRAALDAKAAGRADVPEPPGLDDPDEDPPQPTTD